MMFSHKKNLGFTLIEMMVVITIFSILLLSSYVPYSYMQNKALLKIGTKDVSQSLYQARNLAINGFEGDATTKTNSSIGVYFDTTTLESKEKITYFTFPYSFSGAQIQVDESRDENIKVIKEIVLPKGVQIDRVDGKDKFLFFFDAISGSGSYYYWENGSMVKNKIPSTQRDIIVELSFKGATTSNLQKKIKYYTPTHILDY